MIMILFIAIYQLARKAVRSRPMVCQERRAIPTRITVSGSNTEALMGMGLSDSLSKVEVDHLCDGDLQDDND